MRIFSPVLFSGNVADIRSKSPQLRIYQLLEDWIRLLGTETEAEEKALQKLAYTLQARRNEAVEDVMHRLANEKENFFSVVIRTQDLRARDACLAGMIANPYMQKQHPERVVEANMLLAKTTEAKTTALLDVFALCVSEEPLPYANNELQNRAMRAALFGEAIHFFQRHRLLFETEQLQRITAAKDAYQPKPLES